MQHRALDHRHLPRHVGDASLHDARRVDGQRGRRRRAVPDRARTVGRGSRRHPWANPATNRDAQSAPTGSRSPSTSGSTFRIRPSTPRTRTLVPGAIGVAEAAAAPHRALHVDGAIGREPTPGLADQTDQPSLGRDDPVARLDRHGEPEAVVEPARDRRPARSATARSGSRRPRLRTRGRIRPRTRPARHTSARRTGASARRAPSPDPRQHQREPQPRRAPRPSARRRRAPSGRPPRTPRTRTPAA